MQINIFLNIIDQEKYKYISTVINIIISGNKSIVRNIKQNIFHHDWQQKYNIPPGLERGWTGEHLKQDTAESPEVRAEGRTFVL